MRQIDWDDLRVFLEIGRLQSISLASKRLHLDHSTVSRRLSKLEEVLGHRLLERKHEGIVLNQTGRDLLSYAEAMESQLVAAQAAMFGHAGEAREIVRLSTYEGISSLFIGSRLHLFATQNPKIDVEIMTGLQPVRIDRGDADVFLSFYKPEGRSLHTEQVANMKLYLFAAPCYLEAAGTPTSVEQLRSHKFTTYISDYVTVDSVRWLDEVIPAPKTQFRSTSMITQMFVASQGGGIVLLPAFCPTEQSGLVPILPGEISVERDIWVSSHRDLVHLPKIRKLTRFLKDILQKEVELLQGRRYFDERVRSEPSAAG